MRTPNRDFWKSMDGKPETEVHAIISQRLANSIAALKLEMMERPGDEFFITQAEATLRIAEQQHAKLRKPRPGWVYRYHPLRYVAEKQA